MSEVPRRLAGVAAVTALALASALTLLAAPIKRVEFSDTRLKNGLRVRWHQNGPLSPIRSMAEAKVSISSSVV